MPAVPLSKEMQSVSWVPSTRAALLYLNYRNLPYSFAAEIVRFFEILNI